MEMFYKLPKMREAGWKDKALSFDVAIASPFSSDLHLYAVCSSNRTCILTEIDRRMAECHRLLQH